MRSPEALAWVGMSYACGVPRGPQSMNCICRGRISSYTHCVERKYLSFEKLHDLLDNVCIL